VRGEALRAMGNLDEAEAALLAAVSGAAQRGMQPLLWRAHRSRGMLYQEWQRDDEALQAFASARAIIEQLAATIEDDAIKASFQSRAFALLPEQPVESAVSHPMLTPREQDVVLLLADGLSNRAIAETLFVSERTVETHVSNTLNKLGFSSRTQIAAWAVENGMK
jgi:DNA-binding NarL/FixJ family response regulator